MHNVLRQIVTQKKKDLNAKESGKFRNTILNSKRMVIIGELKFASPTHSFIGNIEGLMAKVKDYEAAGIQAISVITEKNFFKGDTSFILSVKQLTALPILQKDFIINESQLYEAKALGSDAILLIACIVDEETLQSFVVLAKKLGLEPIVEIASEEDLKKVYKTTTNFIAVNARDLDTFTINVKKACQLMKKIPQQFIRLGFSGITSSRELQQYKKAGAKGVLIGTSLMKADNANDFIKSLKV